MIRKESFEKIPLDWKEIASANYGAAGFDRDFTKEEFEEIIVKGCYPMRPLTTFLLLKVSERVGQNERSLVTFLAGNEKRNVVRLCKFRAGCETVHDTGQSV